LLAVFTAVAADQTLFQDAFELQRAGKMDEAVAKYREGLAADPDNAQAHFYLGEAYRSMKEWARAGREFERAAALDRTGETGKSARSRLESLPAVSPDVAALLKSIESELVAIQGGSYEMGDASPGGNADELPVHTVNVPAFHLAMYPVTFEQYDVYAREAGRTLPDDRGWGRGKRPVIGVSWDGAAGFIAWLNKQGTQRYRLPSEAEWEYAARAGGNSAAGNAPVAGATVGDGPDPDADDRTQPVGQSPPNAWGLYDLLGGVLEWQQDCYQDDYAGAPTDGKAWQTGDCSRRVARGGPARHDPAALKPSTRHWHVETFRFGLRGLRLARDD
jgi:formylglycine-generating enzyme required for sulfatase activity